MQYLQQVVEERLGVDVGVGADAEGEMLRAVLEAEQIEHSLVATLDEYPTGLALINVAAQGENAIVIHGGANRALSAAEVRPAMQPASVYLAQLEVPLDALLAFFGAAQQLGGLRILNAAPVTSEAYKLLDKIDLLIVNEIELEQLAYPFLKADTTAREASYAQSARSLLNESLRTVMVTLGEQGARVINVNDDTPIAAPQVPVVDTTGAGDCFCGTLAAALAAGTDLKAAATVAVGAASQAVQSLGALSAIPKKG